MSALRVASLYWLIPLLWRGGRLRLTGWFFAYPTNLRKLVEADLHVCPNALRPCTG